LAEIACGDFRGVYRLRLRWGGRQKAWFLPARWRWGGDFPQSSSLAAALGVAAQMGQPFSGISFVAADKRRNFAGDA
jgi:hypothetical protein